MRHFYAYPLAVLALWMVAQNSHAQVFSNALPIPDTIHASVINLSLDPEVHVFNQDAIGKPLLDTAIKTFAFNFAGDTVGNSYLGPTLIWKTGSQQVIHVTNNLDDTATVHWHGAHVPAKMDGGPHSPIAPGATWTVNFKVLDSTCTLWYHPHAHDETFAQVEMGLSGLIYVDDSTDDLMGDILPHRYGIDDFPIIIQDRNFITSIDSNFELQIDTTQHGYNSASGHSALVFNGVTYPYLEVPPQLVRLRVLNGASRLTYQLGIGPIGSPQDFQLIASDDGYLPQPITVKNFYTGPGIRNELVFDFTQYAGQSIYLLNRAGADGVHGAIGITGERPTHAAFLEFRVQALPVLPVGAMPAFQPIDTFPYNNQTHQRIKNLLGHNSKPDSSHWVPFSINAHQFELGTLNDTIMLNATEKWVIRNNTAVAHPFHIHDIHFFVIAVDTIVTGGTLPRPIRPEYVGPKDNILVFPNEQVTFVTKFTDFATYISPDSAYMYHCHILTHEDGYYAHGGDPGQGPPSTPQRDHFGMMNQFVVWNGLVAAPDEETMVKQMQVFPNPTTGRLNLKGESNKPSTIHVYDMQGREVYRQDLSPFLGTKTIELGNLSRGMFIFEWRGSGGSFTRKIVLE